MNQAEKNQGVDGGGGADLVGKPNETNQCGKGVSVMHDRFGG